MNKCIGLLQTVNCNFRMKLKFSNSQVKTEQLSVRLHSRSQRGKTFEVVCVISTAATKFLAALRLGTSP